jgi:5-methyltetrahydrofolate--homocysteine methyltransferase
LKQGKKPLDIGLKILTPALEEVGKKYEKKEFFLPQLIMAAETMQEASGCLQKELKKNSESMKEAGRILMATVEGDVHDIGKNIVVTVLRNYGYHIIDLGKNVRADKIIAEAKKHNAHIIGLSALMTTTMVKIKEVVGIIKKSGLPFKTLIGGAVVNQQYADEIGADGYGKDAVHAVQVVRKLMTGQKNNVTGKA